MTLMMALMMTTALSFIILKHPMSMGMALLIQSLLIAMTTGFMWLNFWYSYIIFLIMIGGMLVLFIYMTSIASNEKFNYSHKTTMFSLITLTITSIIFMNQETIEQTIQLNSSMTKMTNKQWMFEISMNKFLNLPSSIILMLMIVYLLIALIAVVKITNIAYGPLRMKM